MSIKDRLLTVGLILLLCSMAVIPLLRTDQPCTHDGGLHYYRVVAMKKALDNGILFSRYLPGLAFGYGFPFFNYRAPVSYYLPLALHLTGLSLPISLNLVYVLSILASGCTAYLLGRDLFGHRAAVVVAVAYAYAPYQFLNALVRGNGPESLALALMPLILWTFRRLMIRGQRRWFVASVLSLATLYLTHNISSLLFTPLLAAYLLVLWWVYRKKSHWLAAAGALLLALGLTAFFWAPALGEKGLVQLHQSRNNRNNDFHYNFLGLSEILAPPKGADTSLLNPPMEIQLGLAQALLATSGLALGWRRWRDRERRATLLFFAVAGGVMIWMSTRSSLWLWEHVPLLPFVQFPWRFIGRAILPLSILAGACVPPHPEAPRAWLILSAVVILIIVAGFSTTYPPRGYCPKEAHPTIEDVFAYERRTTMVGVDPTGSYFPTWVARRPTESPLEAQYAKGSPVERFDESRLPPEGSILEAAYGPNRARLVIESPSAFRARYLAFYFPGWQARIDGQPVEIQPTEPEGLIAFEVPAGRHTVTLRFGETPLRLAADALSLLSLAALVIIALLYHGPDRSPASTRSKPQRPSIVLPVVGVLMLIAKVGLIDRIETPFRHAKASPSVAQRVDQPFEDGMTLIGYDLQPADATIRADGALRYDLYWTARQQPTANYQSVIHLVGTDGMRWSPQDSYRPRGYAKYPPATAWAPGQYALDSQVVEPLPGTPPGTYDVVLTLFDKGTLAPISRLNAAGQPAAPELTLGQVTLTRPHRPAPLPENDRLDVPLGKLWLLKANFDRSEATPGDAVYLELLWQTASHPTRETFTLDLVDAGGGVTATFERTPGAPWYPPTQWQPGDVWRGQYALRLPAKMESGSYRWELAGRAIGSLTATAPPHAFTAPPVEIAINARLGDLATLVGARLTPAPGQLQAGDRVSATLVWRAESTPSLSYRVFLHLLDEEGGLIEQSDGVPAQWRRPTTGWLPGEYIVDPHSLAIPADAPPGTYTLVAGMYRPDEGRLITTEGSDSILLSRIEIDGQ